MSIDLTYINERKMVSLGSKEYNIHPRPFYLCGTSQSTSGNDN